MNPFPCHEAGGKLRPVVFLLFLSFILGGFISASSTARADIINLNGTKIDTSLGHGKTVLLTGAAKKSGLTSQRAPDGRMQLIVQFDGPPADGAVESLVEAGAELVSPVPPCSWIVLADSLVETKMKGLGHVKWTGPVHPAHRVDFSVYRDLNPATASCHEPGFLPGKRNFVEKTDCLITLLGAFFSSKRKAAEWLQKQGVKAKTIRTWGQNLRVRASLNASLVENLSCRPEVQNISLDLRPVSNSERSCQIIAANLDPWFGTPVKGYQDWINDIGLDGSGVAVGVIDTRAMEDPYHFGTRMKSICGKDGNFGWEPWGGHGMHVSGIVGGGETCYLDWRGFCVGMGVAPNVKLLNIWGMVDSNICEVLDCHNRYLTESAPGGLMCVISNNSWGYDIFDYPHLYNATDSGWDEISFDYDMDPGNGYQQTIIVFAAGNSGAEGPGPPQGAKNLITVGSCESDFPDVISSFSCFSRMIDGRRRPDVAAPGCSICSAASCEGPDCDMDPFANRHAYKCGASMAAPHVSGCLALFTQWWLEDHACPPSQALCRAAIIASAEDLAGGRYYFDTPFGLDDNPLGHRPDEHQGWGRLNANRLLEEREEHIFVDSEIILDDVGDVYEYHFFPRHPEEELRVVLCWMDPPGAAGAIPALVNDLDLTVTVGDAVFVGNQFVDGYTPNDDSLPHDDYDNVEAVFIQYPVNDQEYHVRVEPSRLLGDGVPGNADLTDQSFALVILHGNKTGNPRGEVSFDQRYYDECTTRLDIEVTDANPQLPVTVRVESDSGDVEDVSMNLWFSTKYVGGIDTKNGEPDPGDGILQIGTENKSQVTVTYHDNDDGFGQPFTATDRAYIDCDDPLYTDPHIDELNARNLQITYTTKKPCWAFNMLGNTEEYAFSKRVVIPTGGFLDQHSALFTHLKSESDYIVHVITMDGSGNWFMDETAGPISFKTGTNETIVINEIQLGETSGIEIVNKGAKTQDITGWQWQWTSTDGTAGSWFFPETQLEPGGILQISSDAGAPEAGRLFAGVQTSWTPTQGGSTSLLNERAMGVDFARWSSFDGSQVSNQPAPDGTSWNEPIASEKGAGRLLANADAFMTFGRNLDSDDTDSSEDWDNTGGKDCDNPSFGEKNRPFRIEGFALKGSGVGEARADVAHGVIIDVASTFTLQRFGMICESAQDNRVAFSVWDNQGPGMWKRLCLRRRDFSATRTALLMSPRFRWTIGPGVKAFMIHFNEPTRRHGLLWSQALPTLSFGDVLAPAVETGVTNTFYGPVSHGKIQQLPGEPPLLPSMVFVTPDDASSPIPQIPADILSPLPEPVLPTGPNVAVTELVAPHLLVKKTARTALIELKNTGDAATTGTRLLVGLSSIRMANSGMVLVGQVPVASLAPGETRNIKLPFTVPENAGRGFQWLVVYAVPQKDVQEHTIIDNLAAQRVLVLPAREGPGMDVTEIVKTLLGITPPSPEHDTTGEGDVDISDVIWGLLFR